jgi:hypothetical protein
MNEELTIAILMADRATRAEVEKHIKTGTYVIEATEFEVQHYIDDLKSCGCWDGETVDGILSGEFNPWLVPIEYEGKKYVIVYVI